MRFVLEVDLTEMADGKEADELAKILRQLAGAVKQVPLSPGDPQSVYDSNYAAVGSWHVEE